MRGEPIYQSFNEPGRSIPVFRVLIVAAALVLAWFLGQSPSLWYVFGLAALAGIVFVFRYPPLGILGIMLVALLVAYSIGTGTQTALNLAFLGIPWLWALVFIRNVFYRQILARAITRETMALIGLVVTAIISLISGYLPWNAFADLAPLRAQLGAVSIFAIAAAACMLAAVLIDSERWLQALVWLFLVVGAGYMVGRAVPALGAVAALVVTQATGSVFWLWMAGLAAGQAIFNRQLDFKVRLALTGLVGLILFVALVQPESRSWASGWIPAVVCLGVITWLRWPRLTAAAGLLLAVPILADLQTITGFLLSGDNAYSLLTRTAALQIVLQIIRANPLLGVGPANYYYYTPLYSILGYYVRFNSHNQYVDILAQTGLVGLFFYLLFFLQMGRTAWKLRSRVEPDGFAAGYIAAGLGGLVASLVSGLLGDWVIPFVYNIGVSGFRASLFGWLFFGGLLALRWITDRRPLPPVSDS